MRPRAKGVVVTRPQEPTGALYVEAKAILKAKADRAAARAAERANTPVPNWKCYPMIFIVGKNIDHNGNWLGGRLPTCRVCGDNLPPREHHVCDGFKAKYVEHDEAWKERQEAKREEVRASRPLRGAPTCSVCSEEIEDFEAAQWHWDQHEGRPEREHYALDGEPDGDLDGYEDEPEEDYCEGDDDGYDCD